MRLALLLPSMLLVACDAGSTTPSNGTRVSAASQVPDTIAADYRCENGTDIAVVYDNREPSVARLTIEGTTFTLPQTIAASGGRYAIGEGPHEGQRMTSWIKGDEATWYEGPTGSQSDPGSDTVVTTCRARG